MVMLSWMLISLLRRRRRPVWLALGATMLVAVVWVGCGGGAPPQHAPGVSLSTSSLTFSSQNMGASSAAQKVTLTNSGNALLSITSIAASGDFHQSNNCVPLVLAAGNCAINVEFSPTATGARTGSLTITDNASGSPHTVSLSGTGVPPATPPGAYNLTVTATLTSGTSTLTHTVGLTLIVN